MDSLALKVSSELSFSAIVDKAFPDVFITNLEQIFSCTVKDIPELLTSRGRKILEQLRDNLISLLISKFSEFKSKSVVLGKNRDDIIKEIVQIGEKIARPNTSVDLSSMFKETEDLSQNDQLIRVVTQLRSDMQELKSEVVELRKLCAHYKQQLGIEVNLLTQPNQPDLLQSEQPSEINIPGTPAEDETPMHIGAPNPIRVIPRRKSCVFIGDLEPPFTKNDLLTYTRDVINVPLIMSDITELPTRSGSKAFKVSLPKNKLNQVITGWKRKGVKAEPYVLKGSHGSKDASNNQRFRNFSHSFFRRHPSRQGRRPTRPAYQNQRWNSQYHPVVDFDSFYQPPSKYKNWPYSDVHHY